MLKLPSCPMPNKNIIVYVDPLLIDSILRNNGALTPPHLLVTTQSIRINLMKLIIAAATIQTGRTNPTSLEKLFDGSYLLEFIKDCDDFCVKKHPDTDKQIEISEDLGVGLSVLVTDHYYQIDWTTLGKIKRRKKSMPDIACMSLSKESITIEAKGSTNESYRRRQKKYAQHQKHGPIPTKVSVASCALFNEASISDIQYLDPPLLPPEDADYERSLLKADHYARLFNLIGQKELSKYFNYMRLRVINDRDFEQFDKKQELYKKIKTKYVRICVREQVYFGNIEKRENESLVFIGVDERLLNVYSFIRFEGHEDGYVETENDTFYLTSDGLCIGFLNSLKSVEGQIQYAQIPHHYDSYSIVDFDHSRKQTLVNYLTHVIGKVGGKVEKETSLDGRYDLGFTLNHKKYAIEIKRNIIARNIEDIFALLPFLSSQSPVSFVLITNTVISDDFVELIRYRNMILIDRIALRKIIEDNEIILEFLK